VPRGPEAGKAIDEILSPGIRRGSANIRHPGFLEGMEIRCTPCATGRRRNYSPLRRITTRRSTGDAGLNTGGMARIRPPRPDGPQLADTGRKILEPFMRGCAADGIDYRDPVIPASCSRNPVRSAGVQCGAWRPGKRQVYLTQLENDLVELLDASVYGALDKSN